MLELGPNICSNFEEATSREWIETNGLGGYASGTISGALTRRYHGLLMIATEPPLGRIVTLSKFEETVLIDGERHALSTNRYHNAVHPGGFKYLAGFRMDPFPIWTFEINRVRIERSLFMVHGENTTITKWRISPRSEIEPADCQVEIRPLVAFRNHHHLQGEGPDFARDVEVEDGQMSIQPRRELPRIYFASNAASIETEGYWYRNFEYRIEQERGFDHREDLYQPFSLKFDLREPATLVATTERTRSTDDVVKLEDREIRRRAELVSRSGIKDKTLWPLVLAADQFVVTRGSGLSVLAGYHWFSDWGRDTMISLPGLALTTNRPEIARNILTEYSKHISEGMIPNRFPDSGGTADYNTVDATLWFFEAVRAYVAHTDDLELIRQDLYDKLVNIIEWHVSGTRYHIHVDSDGLLFAGEHGAQLTWMDAKIDDWVITPRTGKAVEIQALWYNALRIMADLSTRVGGTRRAADHNSMADAARDSFNGQFWNEEHNCLYDVVNGAERDASIRPNQIFAVSLTHTMLSNERARGVVDKVGSELLTPVGLRSLAPNDPRYVGVYEGSPVDRDASYHQGTVWSWLIGPFVGAYRRVHGENDATDAKVAEMVSGLRDHLSRATVGQISEIFDAEPPYHPRGCAAQAWSVAELLRVVPK